MANSAADSTRRSNWKFWQAKKQASVSKKGAYYNSTNAAPFRTYMVSPGQPVWSERNYAQFAAEAYMRNVIAHRAMEIVATAAASIPVAINARPGRNGRRDAKVTDISHLLSNPNPCQAYNAFFHALYQYRQISGNAYIQAAGPRNAIPKELHLLRPDRISIIAGRLGMPEGYRYTIGSNHTDFPVDPITGRSSVLHIKHFHPLNDWYGLSPVEAAAYSIDQHNQAGAWNQALLQNSARPSGALVVRPDSPGGGTLSEEQYSRIKAQMDEQFTGSIHAGKPLLLEGGLDWREMSMSPKDMDFIECKNSAARDIALAFGVPPQLLGIPGDNTYSNLQEARLALWEQTVIPLAQNVIGCLGRWLLPQFGVEGELTADTSHISVLAERNQTMWDKLGKADFLTTDEKRQALGYPPLAQ